MKDFQLVCYHGSPGLPEEFAGLRALLAGFDVVAQSREGYPKEFSIGVRNSEKKAVLLGYSWGGIDALWDASVSAGQIAGVLLVAPYLFPTSRLGGLKKSLIRLPVLGDALLGSAGGKIIDEFLQKSSAPQPVPAEYRRAAETLKSPAILKRAALEKEVSRGAIQVALRQITEKRIPLGLVLGMKDQTSLPEDQIEPLKRHVHISFERSIEGAGHAIPWTHPAELARFVRQFSEAL